MTVVMSLAMADAETEEVGDLDGRGPDRSTKP